MRAVIFENGLQYKEDYPLPQPPPGWARIRVSLAGICRTDLEIMRGYASFSGVLGHEFVGIVDACEENDLIGTRVVGEINVGCGSCSLCTGGLERHCRARRALGIHGLDGCMAEYCCLPSKNLLPLPGTIPDRAAVVIEPLAAACAVLEQVPVAGHERVVVLGDGRMGILCAWVMATRTAHVTLVGHHEEKLRTARWQHIRTSLGQERLPPGEADIVIEATGSPEGLQAAVAACRPRGRVVLKTTMARPMLFDTAGVVVNEITLLGSRCGRFRDALELVDAWPSLPLQRLISGSYPLKEAERAFKHATAARALKIVLEPDR